MWMRAGQSSCGAWESCIAWHAARSRVDYMSPSIRDRRCHGSQAMSRVTSSAAAKATVGIVDSAGIVGSCTTAAKEGPVLNPAVGYHWACGLSVGCGLSVAEWSDRAVAWPGTPGKRPCDFLVEELNAYSVIQCGPWVQHSRLHRA